MRTRWWTLTVAVMAGLPAAGQDAADAPLDPTVGDISSIDTNLRQLPRGLAPNNDFTLIFRDGDNLVRSQGALRAVFPRSTYKLLTQRYVIPEVPPSTVFHVGPSFELPAAPPGPRPGLIDGRIDGRVALGVVHHDTHGAAPPRPTLMRPLPVTIPPPAAPYNRMVVDPEYRAARLRSLMAFAAAARRGGLGDSHLSRIQVNDPDG
jgi:hypothetical protein